MALLAISIAACSSPTLPDVPSLVLWTLGRQVDPIRCGSNMLYVLPLAGVFLLELVQALLLLPRLMDWLLLYPLLPRLNLFARKLHRSLLRELPAEAPNDLLVLLAKDLSAGTTALSSLIKAIIGSPLSQLSFLRAH